MGLTRYNVGQQSDRPATIATAFLRLAGSFFLRSRHGELNYRSPQMECRSMCRVVQALGTFSQTLSFTWRGSGLHPDTRVN